MKTSKFTEAQIAFVLKQAEDGAPVAEVCRKAGISDATFYNWRKKYAGLMPSEMKRLRQSLRSSSVRATIFSRAALMPLTKGMGEELAKRVSAGAASCAKREAAYLEWRMAISWKSSTPQRLRFWHTARR